MEEDEEDDKYEIFPWALGKKAWTSTYPLFLSYRDELWSKMDFRAIVSKRMCDEVSERERRGKQGFPQSMLSELKRMLHMLKSL